MSNITTVFADYSVTYDNKKGDVLSTSPEGALFKGGAALASLKDVALDGAISKAANGRYGAVVDILEVAFPKVGRDTRTLVGIPALNKANFTTFISGIERSPEPKRGFSKRQEVARQIVRTLRNVPALMVESDTRTVEMA
jgi:hypothetical protein